MSSDCIQPLLGTNNDCYKKRQQKQKDVSYRCHVLVFVVVAACYVAFETLPNHSRTARCYASAASFVPIAPSFFSESSHKKSSVVTSYKRKIDSNSVDALSASQSAVEDPTLASCSPLSMNIDELSRVLHGRGRALVSWDCYRQGIDPCLFYAPSLNAPSSTSVVPDNYDTKEIRPKCRATQGLGKESLTRLRKAFPYNPQRGTVEHSVAALSHISTSSDGTTKLLIRMAKDGLEVETVIIPWEKRKRSTICISSQVGCQQGCSFCATGRMGKLRSLSSDEIIVQMYYATQVCRLSKNNNNSTHLYPIDNVVFMGMGEPADNVDNVVRACHILTDRNLFQMAKSKVTISTVAPTPSAFRDLAAAQVTLAWSVHAVCDDTRKFLIPTFDPKRYTMQQMKVELCRVLNSDLSTKRMRTIMLEVALLDGVNDSVQNAIDLADFAQSIIQQVTGLKLVVNLIPWNDIGSNTIRNYKTPSPQAVKEFQNALLERGIYTFIRTTRGDEKNAACGQLATSRNNVK